MLVFTPRGSYARPIGRASGNGVAPVAAAGTAGRGLASRHLWPLHWVWPWPVLAGVPRRSEARLGYRMAIVLRLCDVATSDLRAI